jgi:hypothetical protein
MFGKLENKHLLYASNPIIKDGKRIYNPSAELLLSLGYKPVVQTVRPQDGKQYRCGYEETETEISAVWLSNDLEYWLNTPYDDAVNAEIRKRYGESQEFAVLRQRDEKPEEYAEYFAYCEQCKAHVKSKRQEVDL